MNDQRQPQEKEKVLFPTASTPPVKTAGDRKSFWENEKTVLIFKYVRYAIMIICGLILFGLFNIFVNHSDKFEDSIGTMLGWFFVTLIFFLIITFSPAIIADLKKSTIRKTVYLSVTEELAHIDTLDGHSFEYYIANLLRAFGLTNVTVTQGSGDYGVDIIAYAGEEKIAIQCKHYAKPVGIKAVQEVYAGKAHNNAVAAAVITNNYFTDAARTLAAETDVQLWDRDTIGGMILDIIQKQTPDTTQNTQTK